jgi:hypothetical protein
VFVLLSGNLRPKKVLVRMVGNTVMGPYRADIMAGHHAPACERHPDQAWRRSVNLFVLATTCKKGGCLADTFK